MGLQLVGFPGTVMGNVNLTRENRKRKLNMGVRYAEAGRIIKYGYKMVLNTTDTFHRNLFKRWFGDPTNLTNQNDRYDEDFEPVMKNLEIMTYGFENATVSAYHSSALGVQPGLPGPGFCTGVNLAATPSTSPPSKQKAKRAGIKLIVCDNYWTLPLNWQGRGAQPRQAQIGSIMHEMSHMFAGTADAGLSGTDADAYGSVNCLAVASNRTLNGINRARNNAENYCFYLYELQLKKSYFY